MAAPRPELPRPELSRPRRAGPAVRSRQMQGSHPGSGPEPSRAPLAPRAAAPGPVRAGTERAGPWPMAAGPRSPGCCSSRTSSWQQGLRERGHGQGTPERPGGAALGAWGWGHGGDGDTAHQEWGHTRNGDTQGMETHWEWGHTRNGDTLGMGTHKEWGHSGNEDTVGMRTHKVWGHTRNRDTVGMGTQQEWGHTGYGGMCCCRTRETPNISEGRGYRKQKAEGFII